MIKLNEFTLITGATSGIGKTIAIELSKHSNVVLNGRDPVKLKEVLELCSPNYTHLTWSFNLQKLEDLESSLSNLLMGNCVISHFVHCAGQIKILPLKALLVNDAINIINVNMLSAAFIMKVLVSKKINHSTLKSAVFVSSNLSSHGAKGLSAYGASKGGLDTLMKCLAIELAPNVRVNSVLPGAIHTPMTESIFNNKSVIERMESQYPLGFASTMDIYQAVNFLLSEKASRITGHQLVVDGGRAVNIA